MLLSETCCFSFILLSLIWISCFHRETLHKSFTPLFLSAEDSLYHGCCSFFTHLCFESNLFLIITMNRLLINQHISCRSAAHWWRCSDRRAGHTEDFMICSSIQSNMDHFCSQSNHLWKLVLPWHSWATSTNSATPLVVSFTIALPVATVQVSWHIHQWRLWASKEQQLPATWALHWKQPQVWA